MACKVDTRMLLFRARMVLRPVDSATARVVLHRSVRSRGYKLSREETDPRSLRECVGVCLFFCPCVYPFS
jgi:hypothetical protein